MLRRIYIDSKYRSGGTSSDFTYDLPVSLEVPDNTIGFVDSVFFPNVFTTLHEDNTRLYLIEVDSVTKYEKILLLETGNYTGQDIATLLEVTLNAHCVFTTPYFVSYNGKTGQLTIASTTPTWLCRPGSSRLGRS